MRKSVKTLCLIMFVSLYTFSITTQNVKAYSTSGIVINGFGTGRNSEGTANVDWTITTSNNRGCFFYIDDVEDAHDATGNINCDSVIVYVSSGGNEFVRSEPSKDIYIGWYGDAQFSPTVNNFLSNKMSEYGYTDQGLWNISFINVTEPNRYSSSWSVSGSVDYVTSYKDLYEYIYNNNDSVIKHGDPENPPVTQDNTLPVPQALTCDLHNSYTASNPYIEGSWENPKNASWDAIKDEVKIHIQYKPRFQFYKRFLSVKDGQRSAHQFIDLGVKDNENKNIWINAFPNTPNVNDNIIKFETLQQDMLDVSRMVGAGEIYYSGGATLLNGTQWRVRYEMPDGRVSYWAVYGVNSIGDIKSSDKVTFQDNDDNVVSADAVNYKNSWQTDPNNYNPDSINNSLLSRLRQALNDIQSLPTDMETVASEGSSFANFLQKVWEKFPEIYIIFIGGLIIAIILRILGR